MSPVQNNPEPVPHEILTRRQQILHTRQAREALKERWKRRHLPRSPSCTNSTQDLVSHCQLWVLIFCISALWHPGPLAGSGGERGGNCPPRASQLSEVTNNALFRCRLTDLKPTPQLSPLSNFPTGNNVPLL